ncbi:MAG: O-antigen ligase family protein, partial [Verrucomicrobia bacterium]|nr:O-antigen ligase family protein [Verrucomicrobiota bacterium]
RDRIAWALLIVFAATLPISIALAEPAAMILAVLCLYGVFAGKDRCVMKESLFRLIVLFAGVAVLTSLQGNDPVHSLSKIHRLLLPLCVFPLVALVRGYRKERSRDLIVLIGCYIGGASVLAVYDLVRVPLQVSHGTDLYDAGNMRDPQLYMVALCLVLGAWGHSVWKHRVFWKYAVLSLCAAGMGIHFKRGVWFSFAICAVGIGIMSRRKRILLALLVSAVVVLLLPQSRERLLSLRDIATEQVGGRWVLWTDVAPRLLRDHPMGIGYSAMKHEDLLVYSTSLQPGLNHLHDNVLQVTAEVGWLGLAVWAGWFGYSLILMFRNTRSSRNGDDRGMDIGILWAFSGLILNGLVEYNFGDAEILMAMSLLMGLAMASRTLQEAALSDAPRF